MWRSHRQEHASDFFHGTVASEERNQDGYTSRGYLNVCRADKEIHVHEILQKRFVDHSPDTDSQNDDASKLESWRSHDNVKNNCFQASTLLCWCIKLTHQNDEVGDE